MVWTTYDLSEITDALVAQLTTAVQNSPLWTSEGGVIPNFQVNVTGNSPETMRTGQEGECQLNLYLLHVAQNPFMRNTPIFGTGAMSNTQQPLSLDLTYLLTAYTQQNADREQQAMSIALSWLHENPIQSSATGEYLTVTLGSDTLSEMSALWQSFTVAYRLSTLYRVSIAFLKPSHPPTTPFSPPRQIGLALAPLAAEFVETPQLFGGAREIVLTIPGGDTSDPESVTSIATPPSLVGGQITKIGGQGLAGMPPPDLFLTTLDGSTSWTVTGWLQTPRLDAIAHLLPPAAYAVGAAPSPPATTPVPGAYILSVGTATSRSPGIPIAILPRLNSIANPPILNPSGGSYNLSGAGFVPGATQLFIGSLALDAMSPPGAAPTVGRFSISADGTSISFIPPAGLPSGTLPLRLRVEGVEPLPVWQVALP
jgi:hypothetical protein